MRKIYDRLNRIFIKNLSFCLVFIFTGLSGSINAQIISDDFDTYNIGPLSPQALHWTTWSGNEGDVDDGLVINDIVNSEPNSLLINDSGGGSADVLLLLGKPTEGSYSLDFNVYIPSNARGYYNFQEDEIPGVSNLDVFFNLGGLTPGIGLLSQLDSSFTYPENEWFTIHQVIDLDANLLSFWINGEPVYENFDFNGNLGSLNLASHSDDDELYIDDVVYDYAEPLYPCPFPTIICDNFDSYTTGPLSSQSTHWTTWAGTGNDDGLIVDTISNSEPNSLLIGDYAGYSSDVLLLLGNKDSGTYSLDYNLLIPSGKVAYYNFQEDEIPGVAWNLDVYFNRDGGEPGVGSFDQSDSTFTYPEDEWFSIHQVIDLDANLMSYYINDTLVFDNYIFDGNLGAIDFWSVSDDNELYVDDVVFDEAEPLSSCPFPTIICDNFDSYTIGPLGPQADHWTTWSGNEGGAEDGTVDTNFYKSAPNSMLIDTSGGDPSDVLLLLGNRIDGSYSVDFDLYIPANATGYYNFQEDEVAGVDWNLEVYFNRDGAEPGTISFNQSDSAFAYPEDEWFAVRQVIDLDANLMSFWINGNLVFSDYQYGDWDEDWSLGAVNFYSISDENQMYIDDVVYAEAPPLIPCPFPTLICDFLDNYSIGAIGSQANHWTTWSGIVGGDEDGIITTEQALSSPNSMFIDSTGTQNVLLLLENYYYPSYTYEFNLYIPEDFSGYFNIQNSETSGLEPILDVYFNRDSGMPGQGSFDQYNFTFNYPEDEWFNIKIFFLGYASSLYFIVNEFIVLENLSYSGDMGALNFSSNSTQNKLYIDNVILYENPTGVIELTGLNGFKLYPNPSNGHFTITSEKLTGIFNLAMIDIAGRVVYSEQIELSKNEEK
ncbi:MAG: hypothetical protein DRI54_08120, partial [Bacteroidetes bacterium]